MKACVLLASFWPPQQRAGNMEGTEADSRSAYWKFQSKNRQRVYAELPSWLPPRSNYEPCPNRVVLFSPSIGTEGGAEPETAAFFSHASRIRESFQRHSQVITLTLASYAGIFNKLHPLESQTAPDDNSTIRK